MSKRDLYIKAKPTTPSGWIRPTGWPIFPNTPDTLFMSWAVFEDEVVNRCELTFNTSSIVDWGDGTIDNTINTTKFREYDYATITAPVLTYYDGRNYKPVMITVSKSSGNIINSIIIQNIIPANNIHPNNLLEFEDRLTTLLGEKNYRLSGSQGSTVRNNLAAYCERAHFNDRFSSANSPGAFQNMFRLKVFERPVNFLNNISTGANFLQNFGDGIDIGDITVSNTTFFGSFSRFANIETIGNVTGGNNYQNAFSDSTIKEIGNITSTTNTTLQGCFQNTGQLFKLGVINCPLLTNLQAAFSRTNLAEIVFAPNSCANVTNVTNTFISTVNLRRLVMPGLTRGVNISGNKMQAAALNEFFTSLGNANGSQTITVSLNPGAATCDITIAQLKGYNVVIV
jgi:hypothetical protein